MVTVKVGRYDDPIVRHILYLLPSLRAWWVKNQPQPRTRRCEYCGGSGTDKEALLGICEYCQGRGRYTEEWQAF